jgi:DNA-binding NarL/FixJ family response regulator
MTSNLLPTDYIHYVYNHTDPRTGEVIYVGHGSRGRAWTHGSKLTALRSQEHLAHLESMTQDGFVPSDWVEIIISGLTKADACRQEQALIRLIQPIYNKPQGLGSLKITPEEYKVAKEMRENGQYYHSIAKELGVSTMTVYRALNNQTKNIGEDYAE